MKVYDQGGRAIALGAPLGAGGEGTVYRVSSQECVKIYAKPTPFKEAKILTMIAKPPRPLTDPRCKNGRVAWPAKAVYSRPGGSFVGYVMPLIEVSKYQESEIVFIEKQRDKRFGQKFTYEHLMIAAYNFAMTVYYIHQAGHSVGDLREKNILVDAHGQVCLVDCDSFQIMDEKNRRFYGSETYTPAYLAPEWIGVNMTGVNRRRNDHFALAVWIFQMLMNGMHPYQARGGRASRAPSLSEKIKLGTYPYGSGRRVQPPQAAPDFSRVPRSLQKLFEASFVKGHKRPHVRPEAMDYAKALKREIGRLKNCRKHSSHKYSGDLGTCPFCQKGTRPIGPVNPSPRPVMPLQPARPGPVQPAGPIQPVRPVQPFSPRKSNKHKWIHGVNKIKRQVGLAMYKSQRYQRKLARLFMTWNARRRKLALASPMMMQKISAAILIVLLAGGTLGVAWGIIQVAGSAFTGFTESAPAQAVGQAVGKPVEIEEAKDFQARMETADKTEKDAASQVVSEAEFLENLQTRPLCVEDFEIWHDGGVLYLNQWSDSQHRGDFKIGGEIMAKGLGTYIYPEDADEGRHVMIIELKALKEGTLYLYYGADSEWCGSDLYGQYQLTFSINMVEMGDTAWNNWDETGRIALQVTEGDYVQIELCERSGRRGTLNPIIAFEDGLQGFGANRENE